VTERVPLPQSTSLTALLPPPGHPRCTPSPAPRMSSPRSLDRRLQSPSASSAIRKSGLLVLRLKRRLVRESFSKHAIVRASIRYFRVSSRSMWIIDEHPPMASIAIASLGGFEEFRTANVYRESVSSRAVGSIQAAVLRISPISRRAEWQRKKEPFSLAFGKLPSRHSARSRTRTLDENS